MNIFVIPSWFPSTDWPISGIIIKEQIESFCQFYPSVNIGISVWGQQEEAYLLWTKDHFKNIRKLLKTSTTPFTTELGPNLKLYHSPTFTWTKKFLKGNASGLIQANLKSIESFEADYGPIDLIHAHVAFPAGHIAMEVARKLNKPFCLTEHMGPFPWPHTVDTTGKLLGYYRSPYLKATVNIAVSPFQAEMLRQQGIPNIEVIHNFVNENIFVPSPANLKESEQYTFFSLSFIAPNKGTDVLVRAAHELKKKHSNFKVRVGGGGPFLRECQELATAIGVSEHFTWLGDIDRETSIREFQHCDAFVLASQYESMGVVYVEAMACGKPVIATKCGGPESTVTPDTGLLVEMDNPVALASAMEELIVNRAQYNSQVIRESFLNRFSIQAVAPKFYDLYSAILKDRAANK